MVLFFKRLLGVLFFISYTNLNALDNLNIDEESPKVQIVTPQNDKSGSSSKSANDSDYEGDEFSDCSMYSSKDKRMRSANFKCRKYRKSNDISVNLKRLRRKIRHQKSVSNPVISKNFIHDRSNLIVPESGAFIVPVSEHEYYSIPKEGVFICPNRNPFLSSLSFSQKLAILGAVTIGSSVSFFLFYAPLKSFTTKHLSEWKFFKKLTPSTQRSIVKSIIPALHMFITISVGGAIGLFVAEKFNV